jgi:hypothetical protein
MYAVRDIYAIDGAERITAPSSGFQVLRYLVNSTVFAGYRKFICGFEWQGGPGHLWALEKKQAKHYLNIRLLEAFVP